MQPHFDRPEQRLPEQGHDIAPLRGGGPAYPGAASEPRS
jgi:hypothetical protein